MIVILELNEASIRKVVQYAQMKHLCGQFAPEADPFDALAVGFIRAVAAQHGAEVLGLKEKEPEKQTQTISRKGKLRIPVQKEPEK